MSAVAPSGPEHIGSNTRVLRPAFTPTGQRIAAATVADIRARAAQATPRQQTPAAVTPQQYQPAPQQQQQYQPAPQQQQQQRNFHHQHQHNEPRVHDESNHHERPQTARAVMHGRSKVDPSEAPTAAGKPSGAIVSSRLSTRRASVEKLQPTLRMHQGTDGQDVGVEAHKAALGQGTHQSSFAKNRAQMYSWYTDRNPIFETKPVSSKPQKKPGPQNHACLVTHVSGALHKKTKGSEVDPSVAGVVTNVFDERQRLPRRKPADQPEEGQEFRETYRRNLMPASNNPILHGGDDVQVPRQRMNPNFTETEAEYTSRKKFISTPLSALNIGTQAFQSGAFDLEKDKKLGIRTYKNKEVGQDVINYRYSGGICPAERKVESRQDLQEAYAQKLETARAQATDTHRLYHLYRARAETTSTLLKEHVAPAQVGMGTRDEPLPPNCK